MLSLLDILFPDATLKLVKQFSLMNFSQQKLILSDIKESYKSEPKTAKTETETTTQSNGRGKKSQIRGLRSI